MLSPKSRLGGLHSLIPGEGVTVVNTYLNALKSYPTGLPPIHTAFGGDDVLPSGGQDLAALARSRSRHPSLHPLAGGPLLPRP